jgi:hypothetical protein
MGSTSDFPSVSAAGSHPWFAWSRILADREVVCAINSDTAAGRTAWVTVDAALHAVNDEYIYAYNTNPAAVGTAVTVQARGGRAIEVTLPAAGIAILPPR